MAALQNASLNITTINENTVIAAVTGAQIRVYKAVILNNAATGQTVTVNAASGNTLAVLALPLSLGGGVVLGNGDTSQCPEFRTATSGALIFNLSAATPVVGYLKYEIV